MPTNFPTSVDVLVNPTPTDSLNAPAHSTQHTNANDAIEAIEDYLLNGGQGLTLVKTQTVGTTVSSVTVTSAFSATYENYKIIYTGGTGSTTNVIRLSLGGITTGYYSSLIKNSFNSATVSGALYSNQSSWNYAGAMTTTAASAHIDLHNPFATKSKWGGSAYIQVSTTGDSGTGSFMQGLTTSATDFTLTAGSGTLTGGTIYVYGYGKGQ